MTKKQQAYKKALIKKVHISEKYQAYYKDNPDDYRHKLEEHFGQTSSKMLNIEQLILLVKWLNYELPDMGIVKDKSLDVTASQLSLMQRLWQSYASNKEEKALREFVFKVTTNRYLHLDNISKKDATLCIVALKKTLKE